MADTKITALTALTAADPANDVIPIVDVSDTTMAASGTTKKISVNNILGASGTATLASATITGDLTVRTNVLKVISTGVGIGTATPNPAYILDLTTANDARARQWIADTSFLGSGNLANGYQLRTLSGSTDGLKISNYANTVEYLRLNSSGNVVLSGGTTTANGVGITFPATQVASSDANCLDDYEEGTWVPTQGSGLTVVGAFSSSGTYTKVGRSVYITGQVDGATSVTAASGILCGGLPFSAAQQAAAIAVNSPFNAGSFCAINVTDLYAVTAMAGTTSIRFSATYSV